MEESYRAEGAVLRSTMAHPFLLAVFRAWDEQHKTYGDGDLANHHAYRLEGAKIRDVLGNDVAAKAKHIRHAEATLMTYPVATRR